MNRPRVIAVSAAPAFAESAQRIMEEAGVAGAVDVATADALDDIARLGEPGVLLLDAETLYASPDGARTYRRFLHDYLRAKAARRFETRLIVSVAGGQIDRVYTGVSGAVDAYVRHPVDPVCLRHLLDRIVKGQ